VSKKPTSRSNPAPTPPAPPGQAAAKIDDSGSASAHKDVVLIQGLTEDKKGLKVLRARNDGVEVGEVRPLTHGQSITSDVVRLKPRKEAPYICDVETELAVNELPGRALSTTKERSGPAQVATQKYRENWDTIWASAATTRDPSKLN